MRVIRGNRIGIVGVAALAVLALLALVASPAAAQSPTTLTLSASSATVNEDQGAVTITATLDQPAPEGGVRVTLTSRRIGGRASVGTDFTLPPAFTIAENQTTATADITLIDDVRVEPDRPLVLNATVDAAGIAVTGVTLTLVSDDAPHLTGLYVHPSGDIDVDDDPNDVRVLVMTPNFSESQLASNYATRVNPDIPSVTVRATGAQPGIVKIGLRGSTLVQAPVNSSWNHAVSQAISLSDGENVIEVQKTLYGKTTTYTITVTRGLLPAPGFTVTSGARDRGPALTVALAQRPPESGQSIRVQVRESTTDAWPDAGASNLLPASASGFAHGSTGVLVTGLATGTAYEVRAHLVDRDGAVVSHSGAEAQVTTLSAAPAPTGLTLTPSPPGKGFARIIGARWTAVDDGSPRMQYHLRWRLADQTPEAEWSSYGPFSQTGQVTSDLEDDGTYDVQVASDNGIDPIAWSETGQATVNHSGGL